MGSNTEKINLLLTKYTEKLSENLYLKCISSSFSLLLPLTIFGSLFTLLNNFPIVVINKWIENNNLDYYLSLPTIFTIDIISIYLSFLIAFQYNKLKSENNSIIVGMTSLTCFLLITPLAQKTIDNRVFFCIDLTWTGAKGMLVSIFTGFLTVKVFSFIRSGNWIIKLPENVPEIVFNSFVALIPTVTTGSFFLIITYLISFTNFDSVHEIIYTLIQKPLSSLGNSVFAVIAFTLSTSVLWWFGLHGSQIVNAIASPIFYPLALENLTTYLEGKELNHIYTSSFTSTYTFGGAGMTLSLCIMLLFGKSKRYKALGKVSIVSNIFNINEPILYGTPIILNPIFFIPMNIAPLMSVLVAYYLTYFGVVPKLIGYQIPWTTPPIISGFIQGGYKIALLQVFLLFLTYLIYLPFYKMVSKKDGSWY